jgi:hypothetical protein
MADQWEELTSNFSEDTWDYKKEYEVAGNPDVGVSFEGIYKGMKSDIGQYHSTLYSFENMKGEAVGVWGATALDMSMTQLIDTAVLEVGDTVRILYEGKQKNPKTGRMFNSFKVFKKIVSK